MKKGLNPWVREHRTSLPSQGPSLVSRIWPCVAYSCWILSSRGTKRPDIFLKNGKKGDSESTECNTKETDSWRIAPTPAGAQDGWTWRRAGPSTEEVPARTGSHPRQVPSCLSRTHRMEHTQQVFLTLQL